jgi:hypothetical protein
MLKKMKFFIVILLMVLPIIFIANSQQVKYVYLMDNHYDYIDFMINSGKKIPPFVFHQPYQFMDIFSDSSATGVYNYFKKYWDSYYGNHNLAFQLHLSDKLIYQEKVLNRSRIIWGGHYVAPNITLANHTIFDQDYKHDPLFAGDLSESEDWIYGRVNDAYININFKGFDLFFGRMNRNWGPINFPGLILSNNPYSYDHFLFSYTSGNLKLSILFSQLEELDGKTFSNPDNIYHHTKKYLVGHRLDIGFSQKFQIAVTEMAVYGGAERDIELAFFNPMNFYYGIQRNDKKQMNGIWSLDLFFKPVPRWTLYGQFLLDDIIVNNDPGVSDRDRYPDRLGTMFSLRSGNFVSGLNTDITYVRIWNRTYQSKYNWENYHYRGLGLGYPCAGCEEIKMKFSYWNLFPWYFKNELIIGRYGSVQLTDLFPMIKENFPVEPVDNDFIYTLSIYYYYSSKLNFYSQIKYIDDKNQYTNRIDPSKGWTLFLGVNAVLAKGF